MLKNGGFSMKIVTEKIIVKMKMIAKDSPYMNRFANDMHA